MVRREVPPNRRIRPLRLFYLTICGGRCPGRRGAEGAWRSIGRNSTVASNCQVSLPQGPRWGVRSLPDVFCMRASRRRSVKAPGTRTASLSISGGSGNVAAYVGVWSTCTYPGSCSSRSLRYRRPSIFARPPPTHPLRMLAHGYAGWRFSALGMKHLGRYLRHGLRIAAHWSNAGDTPDQRSSSAIVVSMTMVLVAAERAACVVVPLGRSTVLHQPACQQARRYTSASLYCYSSCSFPTGRAGPGIFFATRRAP